MVNKLRVCVVHTAEARNDIISQQHFDLVINPKDVQTEILTQDERLRADLMEIFPEARHGRLPMGYALLEIEMPINSVIEILGRHYDLDMQDMRFGPVSPIE